MKRTSAGDGRSARRPDRLDESRFERDHYIKELVRQVNFLLELADAGRSRRAHAFRDELVSLLPALARKRRRGRAV